MKLDIDTAPIMAGSRYPDGFNDQCRDMFRRRLAKAAGLTQVGINLLELPPGAWSSQRHWHTQAEEFVYVVDGEVVLVTEGREDVLRRGDCAAFLPTDANGHHLQNRSQTIARVLEIGSPVTRDDECHYPDIDLHATASGHFHKDGTPY
ncbi:MAG: cupin domain-containing protein [Bradyrhizobium sp.]